MGRGRAVQLWQAVALVATLTGLYACSDRTPTGALLGEVALAKGSGRGGGGGGSGATPVVNSTDPSSAPQDVRLNVRVIGSGFDDGSTVRFLLDGRAVSTMVVHGTTYAGATELVADVSIAFDAAVDRYDVEVTTRGGKKGIGIEKFAVTGPTADFPVATAVSPDGLYGDGGGFYLGGIWTNSQQSGGSNGNFNVRPLCSESRSYDVRLPWTLPGTVPDCDDDRTYVNFHVPGLLTAGGDCGAAGCPIGGLPVQDGAFAPTVNYYVTVDTNNDNRYGPPKDKAYNVVWTDARYQVLRRAGDGTTPCAWKVWGETANLYQQSFTPEQVGGAVALEVTINRYDGVCGS